MNSSFPNPHLRHYSQSTCELSIEDKKSPFPAWMKFNKPNPLKFSLELRDGDRPEQAPITITGDRSKLDALHDTVNAYVSNLLAKNPLPQLNVDAVDNRQAPLDSIVPQQTNTSGGQIDRPIDALQMTGEQPHLQADGLSQHLLYLGNMATGNQITVPLSTLQLFDLASTLAEGVAQTNNVADAPNPTTDENPGVITPPLTGGISSADIVEPEVVTASGGTFTDTTINKSDVSEPRVVLPSTKDDRFATESTDGAPVDPSWLREDGSKVKFKESSTASNLNLPKFTDFSSSPLSSVWPWLGLGTVAAGIVAFSLFGNKVGNKPAVIAQNSPTPVPTTTVAMGEYQPSPVPTPSGLTISPSPSISIGTASPGISISSSLSPTIGSGNPNFSTIPGLGAGSNNFSNPRVDRNVTSGLGTGPTLRSPSQVIPSSSPRPSNLNRANNSTPAQPKPSASSRLSNIIPDPATTTVLRDPGSVSDPRFTVPPSNSGPGTIGRNNSTSTRSRNNGNSTSVANSDTDLFAPVSPPNNSTPIKPLSSDTSKPLEIPSNNPSDSTQARETQSYFQKRWKGDPNFSETLQYVIRVDKNGKVGSITAQGGVSQNYLDKTRFLRPGDKLVSPNSSGKDQDVRVLLKPSGDVETLVEP